MLSAEKNMYIAAHFVKILEVGEKQNELIVAISLSSKDRFSLKSGVLTCLCIKQYNLQNLQ